MKEKRFSIMVTKNHPQNTTPQSSILKLTSEDDLVSAILVLFLFNKNPLTFNYLNHKDVVFFIFDNEKREMVDEDLILKVIFYDDISK